MSILMISVQSIASETDDGYIEFLRATAKQTAMAETPYPDAIKFMALGFNESKGVVVLNIALGSEHGKSFTPNDGAVAIAHVHNNKMAILEVDDFETLESMGLRSFVISSDGSKIIELSINDGFKLYRDVSISNESKWVIFESDDIDG
ncbi:hypothetical protein [Aliikangiella sp. IMCC44632]